MADPRARDDRPIIVVAPFSPEGSGSNQHLGAANKVRAVMRILAGSGRRMILVNSAHNAERLAASGSERLRVGDYEIESVSPFTLPSRPVGKLANLLAVRWYARRLKREGAALVWIYNAYAFDAALGLNLARAADCPLVVEMEDWPTARPRGANPKPFIDLLYFRKALKRASLVTCVNEAMLSEIGASGLPVMLLPGTLAPELFENAAVREPFSGESFTLGYFGTLTPEKGADILLELADMLPAEWTLVVCGSGELRDRLRECAASNSRLRFFESLPASALYPLILSCDAIVNPHRPISAMRDGVFPFKVFEALAARKLLISTALPDCGVDLSPVSWFDGTSVGLRESLSGAKAAWSREHSRIQSVAAEVMARFSDAALYDSLAAKLPVLRRIDSQIGP